MVMQFNVQTVQSLIRIVGINILCQQINVTRTLTSHLNVKYAMDKGQY